MDKNLIMIFSFCLFCISLYKMRASCASIYNRIFFAILSLIFLILSALFIVSDYFTGDGIDESVLYHLKIGLGGAGFLEYWQIILTVGTGLIIFCTYLYRMLHGSIKSSGINQSRLHHSTVYAFLLFSMILNPAVIDLFSLARADDKPAANFKWYYRSPQIVAKPAMKKNLIYIYAESLERTYFDESIFPGLIKELRSIESMSTHFTDIGGVNKASWTIAGMTASQCGIPLANPTDPNSMSGMDTFLTGAVCLGDLLHDEGYKLSYLGGALLEFSGKGNFYSDHGFDNVRGLDELRPLLHDRAYLNRWGLYDDTLFDIGFNEFQNMSTMDKPFGLFLLTLDTHSPEGHISKSCNNIVYKDGSNPMLNAVACSDFLISRFVRKILASPQAADTVIVIASDHLAMRCTATDLLDKGDRKNLFMIIDAGAPGAIEVAKKGSTLDIGPTLLHVLGYEGRIGLGRDLLGTEYSLMNELDDLDNILRAWTPELTAFWQFPKIDKHIEVDVTIGTIKLDDRTFKLPVLVQFNDELETKLGFSSYNSPNSANSYGLIWDVFMLDMDTAFLWIDDCSIMHKIDTSLNEKGYCMMAGKMGTGRFVTSNINKKTVLRPDDLREIALLNTTDDIYYQNKKRVAKILSKLETNGTLYSIATKPE